MIPLTFFFFFFLVLVVGLNIENAKLTKYETIKKCLTKLQRTHKQTFRPMNKHKHCNDKIVLFTKEKLTFYENVNIVVWFEVS